VAHFYNLFLFVPELPLGFGGEPVGATPVVEPGERPSRHG